MDAHEASRVARCLSWWWSQLIWSSFGNASVLSASIHSEQHGHVKVRFLRLWRPVLNGHGMLGVAVVRRRTQARLVEGRDVRPRRHPRDTGRQQIRSQDPSQCPSSILRVQSTVHARHWAKWFSCSHRQFQFSCESEEGHGCTPQMQSP